MKMIFQKTLSLLLVLTMFFTGFGEAIPAFAANISLAKMKKYQPVITKIEIADPATTTHFPTSYNVYDIHIDLPKDYENVSAEVYVSTTKDGTYKKIEGSCQGSDYKDGVIRFYYDTVNGDYVANHTKLRYVKVRCYRRYTWEEYESVNRDWMEAEKFTGYSKYSEPAEIPAAVPDKSGLFGYWTSPTKLFLSVLRNDAYKVHFQIRKTGTKTWQNLSTTKLVQRGKITHNVSLTVKEGESFEFRARYYYKRNGKNICGPYSYACSDDFESTPRVNILSALQFDSGKSDNIALFWDTEFEHDAGGPDDYYQVAYRKAGSKDAWKTFKVGKETYSRYDVNNQTASLNDRYSGNFTTNKIKVGYEYKVRLVRIGNTPYYMPTSYGKYSKTFTVTKASVKYQHAMHNDLTDLWIDDSTDADRPIYDVNLTKDENLAALRRYLKGTVGMRGTMFYDLGFYPVGGLHFDQDRIGIMMHSDGSTEGAVALEVLRFYTQDNELAGRLFALQSALWQFGHADPKYFGFTEVQDYGWVYSGVNSLTNEWVKDKTSGGCILEYNGRQIEMSQMRVTRGNNDNVRLRIFWIDQP